MGVHSKAKVADLSKQLDERMKKLKQVITGRKLNEYEPMEKHSPENLTSVSASDVRIAVDDFNTILKEIKRVLK